MGLEMQPTISNDCKWIIPLYCAALIMLILFHDPHDPTAHIFYLRGSLGSLLLVCHLTPL